MEKETKRRKKQDATNLMSLPPEIRLEILYRLSSFADVERLCAVNEDFYDWCKSFDLRADWERHRVLDKVRYEIAVRAYEQSLLPPIGAKLIKGDSIIFVKKDNMVLWHANIKVFKRLGVERHRTVEINQLSRDEKVRLIYDFLDMGYFWEYIETEDEFWHEETIHYLRNKCFECGENTNSYCSLCGKQYCGQVCFAKDDCNK